MTLFTTHYSIHKLQCAESHVWGYMASPHMEFEGLRQIQLLYVPITMCAQPVVG